VNADGAAVPDRVLPAPEWQIRLLARQQHGIRLGLGVMEELTARLGHPERGLRFVHVAGTNGKGSVCAMLDSVLREAGLSTALYTSPHLMRLGERFRIGGVDADDAALERWWSVVEPQVDAMTAGGSGVPTFFDVATAMALVGFREAGVEWVVWETGMGGRLDSTNIVTPALSVVTAIGRDHMAYLGNTIDAIAGEKAGIFKHGVPAVSAAQTDAARAVLEREALARGVHLEVCRPDAARSVEQNLAGQWVIADGMMLRLGLLGTHQAENAAVVLRAVSALRRQGVAVGEEHVRAGLASVRWPGRLQVLRTNPPWLLDGAHNAAGAAALAREVHRLFGVRDWDLVIGMLDDKEADAVLGQLVPGATEVHAVPVESERAMDPARLAAVARGVSPRARVTTHATLSAGIEAARAGGRAVCVCGSLFLCGTILRRGDGVELD
jgi:dihydrofolate synthase/folylpolyglutamate synthase